MCSECACDDPECAIECVPRRHNWLYRHKRLSKDGREIFTCSQRFWFRANAWYRPREDEPWTFIEDLAELRAVL